MKQYQKYKINLVLMLIIGIGLALLTSCGDDTFQQARPISPEVSNKGKNEKEDQKEKVEEIKDTLKNYFKKTYKNLPKQFTLTPKGEGEGVVTYLIYSLTSEKDAKGVLKIAGEEVKDTIRVPFPNKPINLTFIPDPGEGEYVLRFKSYNQFGMPALNTTVYRLLVIDNLAPVAKFKIVLIDKEKSQYNFDAFASFDADEKFGGAIKMYEYTISWNGKKKPIIRTYYDPKNIKTGSTPIYLSEAGKYTISLRVEDNEGAYSEPFIQTLEI